MTQEDGLSDLYKEIGPPVLVTTGQRNSLFDGNSTIDCLTADWSPRGERQRRASSRVFLVGGLAIIVNIIGKVWTKRAVQDDMKWLVLP